MLNINIEIDNFPNFSKLAEKVADTVIKHLKAQEPVINLLLSDDQTIRKLNKQYRNFDKPTNVLSFAYEDEEELGDIIISMETLQREAEEKGIPLEHHFTHLLIHGILHLFGHDHINDVEAEAMEKLEVEILSELGIENPY